MRKNNTNIEVIGMKLNLRQYVKWLRGMGWWKEMAAAVAIIFALAPLLAISAVSAAQPPTLMVTAGSQTLVAGEENLVEVTITNMGEYTAGATFMVVGLPSSGASGTVMILNGSDGKFFLGDIAPGENKTVTLHVIVSEGATGGFYQISFIFTYQYIGTVSDSRYIGFVVPDTEVRMAKLDLSLTPQNLVAGANNSMTLTVRNIGNGTADSLKASLTLPGSQGTTSQYILMGSSGTWQIGELDAGDEATIPIEVYVLPSASNTASTFTITASYADQQSKSNAQTGSFGILTTGSVDIVILRVSTSPSKVSQGNPFSLTVTLLNIGSTTAQSVIFTPNGTDQITPLSQTKIFLGDLGTNAPSSLTLPFTAGNVTAGNYTLSISYSYRNSLGMDTTKTLLVPFELVLDTTASNSTAQQTTGFSTTSLLLFAIPVFVVIAVIAYILYRRRSGSGR
jgi:hypothetical protein